MKTLIATDGTTTRGECSSSSRSCEGVTNAVSDIGSILLHADASAPCVNRLELALDLAARLDAELTVVFGVAPRDGSGYAYSAAAALDESVADAAERESARHRLRCHRALEGCEVRWYDIVGESVMRGFVAEALYADLLVVGQEGSAGEAESSLHGFAESVILASSKPTLVIPLRPRHATVGRRVLVAWNGSTQAARALTGALPLPRVPTRSIWSRGRLSCLPRHSAAPTPATFSVDTGSTRACISSSRPREWAPRLPR